MWKSLPGHTTQCSNVQIITYLNQSPNYGHSNNLNWKQLQIMLQITLTSHNQRSPNRWIYYTLTIIKQDLLLTTLLPNYFLIFIKLRVQQTTDLIFVLVFLNFQCYISFRIFKCLLCIFLFKSLVKFFITLSFIFLMCTTDLTPIILQDF